MPEGNGDYLSRFERMEKILDRILQVQEVQGRNLESLVEMLGRHDGLIEKIETNLAEATDKLNLMIGREMKREGGLEAL